MELKLKVLESIYCIVKFHNEKEIPDSIKKSAFYSLTKTAEEISVICEERFVTQKIEAQNIESSWKIMKVLGILDFSLVGIIAKISSTLSKAGISIFTVSTFNTDYILVKEEKLKEALDALSLEGFEVEN